MTSFLHSQAVDLPREAVTTKGGRPLHIRPMRAGDAALLVDLFEQLSPETRRRRFLSPVGNLPAERIWQEARRLSTLDAARAVALVAAVHEHGRECVVGVARMHRHADQTCAEVALVVRDDYQNEGVGSILFERLARLARRHGVRCLQALMLAENTAMRRLMEAAGAKVSSTTLRGETTMTIELP